MDTLELIAELKKMEIGEEKMIDGHKIKRINNHIYDYKCKCCEGRGIAYGKR